MIKSPLEQILSVATTPRYPSCNVVLSVADAARLGEAIACAAALATDPDGKKVGAHGDISALPVLAAKIVGEWLHTSVWLESSLNEGPAFEAEYRSEFGN